MIGMGRAITKTPQMQQQAAMTFPVKTHAWMRPNTFWNTHNPKNGAYFPGDFELITGPHVTIVNRQYRNVLYRRHSIAIRLADPGGSMRDDLTSYGENPYDLLRPFLFVDNIDVGSTVRCKVRLCPNSLTKVQSVEFPVKNTLLNLSATRHGRPTPQDIHRCYEKLMGINNLIGNCTFTCECTTNNVNGKLQKKENQAQKAIILQQLIFQANWKENGIGPLSNLDTTETVDRPNTSKIQDFRALPVPPFERRKLLIDTRGVVIPGLRREDVGGDSLPTVDVFFLGVVKVYNSVIDGVFTPLCGREYICNARPNAVAAIRLILLIRYQSTRIRSFIKFNIFAFPALVSLLCAAAADLVFLTPTSIKGGRFLFETRPVLRRNFFFGLESFVFEMAVVVAAERTFLRDLLATQLSLSLRDGL
uniref:Uncharacterized protein n=1 Tax=Romanomermis culicivorax TaxID=13658 RepID=A0A915I1D4_ROMCU